MLATYSKWMQGSEDPCMVKFPESFQRKDYKSLFRFLGEGLSGGGVIAFLCFAAYALHFNAATVGFLFLLVVVSVAILWGFWQATFVSALACACLDYFFYPPLLVFSMTDPQDWVALGAFELSALVVSRLSWKEQRNFQEAKLQRTTMEQLYELSRNTLLINMHQPPGPQLVELIQQIFEVEAVALFDTNTGEIATTGVWPGEEQELAKECFFLHVEDDNQASRISRRLLRVGGNPVGAVALRGSLNPLVTNALASLVAITLDRWSSFQKESRIEAAHQSERLRAAVLDSLAHAFKTPLTAIQTASSGLWEVGDLSSPQKELASLIEDETSELIQLCTRLLQTAKLEAEELSLGKDEIAVSTLISKALGELPGLTTGRSVEVSVSDPDLTVHGDCELLSMALVQYLDNAAKYAFAGTPVRVKAWESHAEVLISVHNLGPSIPISDRERIFQRFYRSESSRHLAAGTGIGLSAVKMAAEAHRGHVWVISDEEEGTTFFLSLPQEGRRQL